MRIPLSSPVRKAAFLSGCTTACLLAWVLCLQSLAEYWLTRPGTVEGFQRAARIQPLNAFYPQVLGTALIPSDFQRAASMLEQSARINPHSSATWLSLSQAYAVLGDNKRQHDAILHALAVDPTDINVEWDAANFLIQNGQLDPALHLICEVVKDDPARAGQAMQIAFRATGGDLTKTLLAIPATASARLQFVRWLIDHDQPSLADEVWPTVVSAPGKVRESDVLFYFDSLIGRHEVSQARSVWNTIQTIDSDIRRRSDSDNLVVNGDFEQNLLNGGFDWRYTHTDGIHVTLDTSIFHGGTRSLALQFDGDNINDAGVYELVPVEPDTQYTIRAFARADDLEGANGVRLAVTDYYSNTMLVSTDEIIGSTSWRETTADFLTSPATRLVKINLVRLPSLGRIRGQLWIDDIKMEKRQ
jgi:tetratricopeptide (TPR) repeat protein